MIHGMKQRLHALHERQDFSRNPPLLRRLFFIARKKRPAVTVWNHEIKSLLICYVFASGRHEHCESKRAGSNPQCMKRSMLMKKWMSTPAAIILMASFLAQAGTAGTEYYTVQ
jgi:hypothetical protein